MRRRELLAGALGIGVVGAGAAVAMGKFGDDGERVDPVEAKVIDTSGDGSETMTVPREGEVTFLEAFATTCRICAETMPELAVAHEKFGDAVQFVSMTIEPVGLTVEPEEVVDWFDEHGGAWTVVHDEEHAIIEQLDVTATPYSFVLDQRNRVTWRHSGGTTSEVLHREIEKVLDEET